MILCCSRFHRQAVRRSFPLRVSDAVSEVSCVRAARVTVLSARIQTNKKKIPGATTLFDETSTR